MRVLILVVFVAFQISVKAQNMGVNMPVSTLPNTTLDVNGSIAFREGTALALSFAVNNDVSLGNYSFYRITQPVAMAFSITGFSGGQDGRVLTIINASTQILTLTHQTTSTSLAANQINTGGANISLTANGVATLVYNFTLSKWVLTGGEGFIKNWSLTGNSGTTAGTNFMGTTDAQALVFKTNATEGMRLSTGQNLSIGAASPLSTARLHVENTGSNYAFYAPTSTNYNHFAGNTAFGGYSSNPNDFSLLWAGTVDNAISLQKDFTSFTAGTLYRGLSTVLRLSPSASISNTIHGVTNDIQTNAASTGNFTSLIRAVGADFRHYGSGTVTEVEGLNAHVGNYGSGTITDAYGVQAHVFKSTGTITNAYGGQFLAWGGSTANYGLYSNPSNSATNNYMYYGAMTAGSNTDWGIYLTGEDKNYFSSLVGIGTTNPIAALHVSSSNAGLYNDILLSGYNNADVPIFNIRRARGTETAPANLVNNDALGGNHYYGYVNSGWNYLSGVQGIYKGNGTTILSNLEFLASNAVRMTLDENGSLGIGTATPTSGYKLSVNGNADKAGGGSWGTFSDSRVKRNVHQFTEGLATLEKINPVWFQYNTKSGYSDTSKTYVGVIAQDIEKVAPYMVEKTKTSNFNDQRVYDSNALNYILVNSVKELSAENKQLKAENAALKEAMEKNSRDIEGIKAMLKTKQQ